MRQNGEADHRAYYVFFFGFSLLMFVQTIYNWKPVIANFAGVGMWPVAAFCFFCIGIFASFWRQEEKFGHPFFTYAAILLMLTIVIIQNWFSWLSIFPPLLMVAGALGVQAVKPKNATMWQEDIAAAILIGSLIQKP
jgi:uncharacterized membrane protein YhhN